MPADSRLKDQHLIGETFGTGSVSLVKPNQIIHMKGEPKIIDKH